jgi:transposase
MMHGPEKSDLAILAGKPANKAEQPAPERSAAELNASEPVERRAGTKGNAGQQSTCRTQSRTSVSQALERMRQAIAVWTRGRRSYGAGGGGINRMKGALARLGIRGFKAHLRKAPERLAGLRTAEGTGLPTNMIEEFRRDMARLALVREQISSIEKTRAERLEQAPDTGPHAMVRLLARVIGIGIETADMLVREILSRNLRDRRALARYAGLTGSPDESGLKSREKGLAKAGNARVRRGLIQLAWRFLMFQKDSALARWYRTRTEGPSGARKTTMIVALARKLLIALWRLVTTGEVPDGVELRSAA